MSVKQPFWKCHHWKSIGIYTCKQVMPYWSLELIFKVNLKLESRNQEIQHGCQVAMLEVHQNNSSCFHFKCGINLLTHSQTSSATLLEIGNGWINSSYILIDIIIGTDGFPFDKPVIIHKPIGKLYQCKNAVLLKQYLTLKQFPTSISDCLYSHTVPWLHGFVHGKVNYRL